MFFTSGGSESVEAAWKLVRQYHLANGEPQRTKVIARDRAYHGVTLGALSFTGVPGFKEPFGAAGRRDLPRLEHERVPTRRVRGRAHVAPARRDRGGDRARGGPETIAMIIAEPVQNAGGCLQPPDGYWAGLREICDRHGILLVADEVITGFGRLGEWFGVTRFGAVPDLITTAKGLTSAYAPMGAVLASDRVAAPLYDAGRTLLHGITFGGHPLSAAIALKNLELFEREQVLDNVREHEPHLATLLESLRRLPIVGDVRGSGFFWAVELVPDGPDEPLRRRAARGAAPPVPAGRADPGAADRARRRPRRHRDPDRAAADLRRGRARRSRRAPRRRAREPSPTTWASRRAERPVRARCQRVQSKNRACSAGA